LNRFFRVGDGFAGELKAGMALNLRAGDGVSSLAFDGDDGSLSLNLPGSSAPGVDSFGEGLEALAVDPARPDLLPKAFDPP
jgi:hypothetical protein